MNKIVIIGTIILAAIVLAVIVSQTSQPIDTDTGRTIGNTPEEEEDFYWMDKAVEEQNPVLCENIVDLWKKETCKADAGQS